MPLALPEAQAPASPPLRPDQPRPMAVQQPDVGRGAARGGSRPELRWVMQLPDPPSSALPPPPPLQAQRGGLLPPPPGVAPAAQGRAEHGRKAGSCPRGSRRGCMGSGRHSSRGRQPPLPPSLLSMPPLPLQPPEASHRRSAAERTTTGASSTTPTTRGVRSSPGTTPLRHRRRPEGRSRRRRPGRRAQLQEPQEEGATGACRP